MSRRRGGEVVNDAKTPTQPPMGMQKCKEALTPIFGCIHRSCAMVMIDVALLWTAPAC